MQELVTYIVNSLVDNPENVEITVEGKNINIYATTSESVKLSVSRVKLQKQLEQL